MDILDVGYTDRGEQLSVSPAEYEEKISGKKTTLSIAVDSKNDFDKVPLDQLPWDKAAVSQSMQDSETGEPGNPQTFVRVLADSKNLYLNFDATESSPDKIVAAIKDNGGAVWKDDDVEVFLAPTRQPGKFYQILVNPKGIFTEADHQGNTVDHHWSSGSRIQAKTTKEGWNVKLAIPYTALGLTSAPLPGDVWGANFVRSRQSPPATHMAWNPTFGSFLRSDRFGELIFTAQQ